MMHDDHLIGGSSRWRLFQGRLVEIPQWSGTWMKPLKWSDEVKMQGTKEMTRMRAMEEAKTVVEMVKKKAERKGRLEMTLKTKMMIVRRNLIYLSTGDEVGQQEVEEAAAVAAQVMMTDQALRGEGADDAAGTVVTTGAAGGDDIRIHTGTDMEEGDVVGTAGQVTTAQTTIPIITAHVGAPLHNRM